MSAEIVQFVPRPRNLLPSERLRQEMIRVARARYQAIFPDDFTETEAIEDTAPCETKPDNLA